MRYAREGLLNRYEIFGRLVVPITFILLLPVAFAASVKQDDRADNAFTFAYDASGAELVAATSSTRYRFDDDVSLFVNVAETDAGEPLLATARFALIAKEAIKYEGTMTLSVKSVEGATAFQTSRAVSFTLRPRKGKRVRTFTFPFEVPTGDYQVNVRFSR